MPRSSLLLCLLLASCVHDEVNLDDFTFTGDESEGPPGAECAGEESTVSCSGGGESEDEPPPDGEGDGPPQDPCELLDCGQDEFCDEELGRCVPLGKDVCAGTFECIGGCGEDDGRCGIDCVRPTAFEERTRVLSLLACMDECGDDPFCVEHLCDDERWSCHEGAAAPDATCVAVIFCHFVCGDDEACHGQCDDWGGGADDGYEEWRDCMAGQCDPGQQCDPDVCDPAMEECVDLAFEERCLQFCADELYSCEEALIQACHEACEMPDWQALVALECIDDDNLEASCDPGALGGCLDGARRTPPPDDVGPGPGPGPGNGDLAYEQILHETFDDGGPSHDWLEIHGGWALDERAQVGECPGCPETPAMLQSDEDLPTQRGFAQLSFTAQLDPDDDSSQVWVAMHAELNGPIPDVELDRFIGMRLASGPNGVHLWSSGVGGVGPDLRLTTPVSQDQPYDVRLTCFGPFGYDIGIFERGRAPEVVGVGFFDSPCELPPNGAQARLLLGGTPGVWIDDVRLDLLPCEVDGPPLDQRTGVCGRVAWMPFDEHTREAIQGWDPIRVPLNQDGPVEQGGRQSVFITGHDGTFEYSRPPGADSSRWAVDMWVRPHDPPEEPLDLRERTLFDDRVPVPNQEGQAGRRLLLDGNNEVVCEIWGERANEPLVARVGGDVGWDVWTRVGCSWDGDALRAWKNRERSAPVQPERFKYRPSRAPLTIGGPAEEGLGAALRGWISDVRLHAIPKGQPYFAE